LTRLQETSQPAFDPYRVQWRSDRLEWVMKNGFADWVMEEVRAGRAFFPLPVARASRDSGRQIMPRRYARPAAVKRCIAFSAAGPMMSGVCNSANSASATTRCPHGASGWRGAGSQRWTSLR
jgi:hypothetical protein